MRLAARSRDCHAAASAGIVYCDVPDVIGAEINVAQQRFAERGFKVAGVKADYSGRPRDTVIMQSLKAWTREQCGSRVYLQVSAGPQPCEVPNLEAIDIAGARRVLKDRNLQLGEVSTQHSERIADTVLKPVPEREHHSGVRFEDRRDDSDTAAADLRPGAARERRGQRSPHA